MAGRGAMQALAQVSELLAQNKPVIKVQSFPFDRAAEACQISQSGHVRGNSSWSRRFKPTA
jgi:hypothetical protein